MNRVLLILLAACCVEAFVVRTTPFSKPELVKRDPEVVSMDDPYATTCNEPTSNTPNAPAPKIIEEAEGDGLVQPVNSPYNLSYVDHSFYKSALIWNSTYFEEHWNNITNGTHRVIVHPVLKNAAYRHVYRDFSLQMPLPFEFPFYGHFLQNITISTGGYLFTGQSGHRWYSQEQNISPLMANFDVSLDDNSTVVLYEEATQLTVVWENMKVRDKQHLKFTFAVTLYKNGDIHFAYKHIPIKIQSIEDKVYPVFVGLADSYFLSDVTPYVHRMTIHNYSRIPFNTYNIKSDSVLQLLAQKSCPIYNTCEACIAHETKYGTFNCKWCSSLQKCTSGADFYRPYMADCPFSKVCESRAQEIETSPRLVFFHRIYNYRY